MDIAEWLRGLGLEQYEPAFRENKISPDLLPSLTAEDLKDLGVVLVGDRRRLLQAIASLTSAPASKAAVPDTRPATQPEAERRQLSVMFCDLVGSTALSAQLDPEDLRSLIGGYHRCCAEVIQQAGGFVAKYMGDGVLAYFGYPAAHENDAEQAVRSGLALLNKVAELQAPERLQVRIGIATGVVVVGDLIGQGAAQEQAVIGETPNLAARLQALAQPGTVVIDASTRRLTGRLFEYADLGAVELKGFVAPAMAACVLRESGAESRFEALRAASTPFVGRDEELALLERRWQQAKAGEGSVVLVSGEPGIGKSRLAQTLLERVAEEPHMRLRYFCSPHHQDSALYPIIAQLEHAAGFRREDTTEQRLDKLEALLRQATNNVGESATLLAELLSIPAGDRYPPLNLTPQKRKEKTFRALVEQVEGLTARQPVLMLFEDAHWSDPTSLELLDLIVDRAPRLALLLILTYRPSPAYGEFAPPWAGRPHVSLLSLSRLPQRERGSIIVGVTGGKALPWDIAEQIVERTDGVPLFVEELTKAVVESGFLTDAGDHYDLAGPVPSLAIPATLQASLLARLDRLAPVREVAQIGAVLGRQFSHELISAVAPMPQGQVDNALTQLLGAELLYRRGIPPDAEYMFKHALVQDAAYSTLLRSRRMQLHALIAARLEDRFPEIVAAQPALLARHCAEAGFSKKAIAYWLRAGQHSLARCQMKEAVALLRKGLEALASLPDDTWHLEQELELQVALAPALSATRGWSATEVGDTVIRARALAEQINRPDQLAGLFQTQWAFHLVRSEHREALALAKQIEQIGAARNDIALQLVGHFTNGATHFFLGEFIAARTLLEQCLRFSDSQLRASKTLPINDPLAMVLGYLSLILTYLGYVDQAQSRLNEALSEARRLAHALTLTNVTSFANWRDTLIRSPEHRHVEELLALSAEHGFSFYRLWATVYHGQSLIAVGQVQEGLALFEQGLTAVRATETVLVTSRALIMLAEAHGKLNALKAGLDCLSQAAQIIQVTQERTDEAELNRVRGDLLNAMGDQSEAEWSYRQAVAVAQRQAAKLFQLRASTSLARLWRDQGKIADAHDLLAPIYGWFTEGFDAPDLIEAKALLGELGAALGREPAV